MYEIEQNETNYIYVRKDGKRVATYRVDRLIDPSEHLYYINKTKEMRGEKVDKD